jgi:hypothetical protein
MEVEKMSQRIMIDDAFIENNELLLVIGSEIAIADLTATGQMLVDSNQVSFIYIVEKENSYEFITIPEQTWSVIQEALLASMDVNLINKQDKLPLPGFQGELDYLIANITGNSNYGEEMVAKVEQVFLPPSA